MCNGVNHKFRKSGTLVFQDEITLTVQLNLASCMDLNKFGTRGSLIEWDYSSSLLSTL